MIESIQNDSSYVKYNKMSTDLKTVISWCKLRYIICNESLTVFETLVKSYEENERNWFFKFIEKLRNINQVEFDPEMSMLLDDKELSCEEEIKTNKYFVNLARKIEKWQENAPFMRSYWGAWLKEWEEISKIVEVKYSQMTKGLGLFLKKDLIYSEFGKLIKGQLIKTGNLEEETLDKHISIITLDNLDFRRLAGEKEEVLQKMTKEEISSFEQSYFIIGWLSLLNHSHCEESPQFWLCTDQNEKKQYLENYKMFKRIRTIQIMGLQNPFGDEYTIYKKNSELFANYGQRYFKQNDDDDENECLCPKCKNQDTSMLFENNIPTVYQIIPITKRKKRTFDDFEKNQENIPQQEEKKRKK